MQTALVMPWSKGRLLGFRFFAVFFSLFIFPFPLSSIPGVMQLTSWYDKAWEIFTKWSGKHVLHLPYDITVMPNGSGDTTFNYVQLFLIFTLAIIAAIIWTAIDRKARNYDRFSYWMAVYVRYYLAFNMLGYGFAKVIKTQFPLPGITRLAEPLGNFSPMGLAWTFMGYSKAYNMFTGLGEVIGGLLILFRRTVLAGALLLVVVMGNIVALNFCYDIPVKIFSSLLLLMCLWVAWPYRTRMYQFFIKNCDILPHPFYNITVKKWQHITLRVVKYLIIAWAFGSNFYDNYTYYAEHGDDTPRQEFEGVYDVQYFVRNNDTVLPLTTDTTRWRKLYINSSGGANIQLMNDTMRRFWVDKDSKEKKWDFTNRVDTNYKFTLRYIRQDSTNMLFSGLIGNDSLLVKMNKLPDNYPLLRRGFHWINEYPYNR